MSTEKRMFELFVNGIFFNGFVLISRYHHYGIRLSALGMDLKFNFWIVCTQKITAVDYYYYYHCNDQQYIGCHIELLFEPLAVDRTLIRFTFSYFIRVFSLGIRSINWVDFWNETKTKYLTHWNMKLSLAIGTFILIHFYSIVVQPIYGNVIIPFHSIWMQNPKCIFIMDHSTILLYQNINGTLNICHLSQIAFTRIYFTTGMMRYKKSQTINGNMSMFQIQFEKYLKWKKIMYKMDAFSCSNHRWQF